MSLAKNYGIPGIAALTYSHHFTGDRLAGEDIRYRPTDVAVQLRPGGYWSHTKESGMARYKAQKFKTCTARGSQCHGDNLPSGTSIEHTARGRRRARRHGLGSATARQAAHQKPVWGKQRKLCDASLPPAQRMPGPTGLNLLQLLERRLDNVVYRLGFARTPPMSRQVVGHGRVL